MEINLFLAAAISFLFLFLYFSEYKENKNLNLKIRSSEKELIEFKKELSEIKNDKTDTCLNYISEIERLEKRVEEFRGHNKALNQKVINLKREIRKINESTISE